VSAEQARRAWLVEALTDDNRVWLSRDLEPLAIKYDRMEDDPYDYLRATAGVFLRDVGRSGTMRTTTSFLTEPSASEVLLVGDPHPENFGTLWPGEAAPVLLEVNDFDGAVFGPYLLDVRRLALGLAFLADEGGCRCGDVVVGSMAEAYLQSVQDGGARPALVDGDEGVIAQDLLDTVVTDGSARATWLEVTEPGVGGRRFRIDGVLDGAGRGLLRLSTEEHGQLDRLLASWDARPAGFRELSRARRFGSGIASLPAVRYVVAYDLGDEGSEDDRLLSIREVVDPPAVPGVHEGASGYWASSAQRIESTARTLWSRPDADPRYEGLKDGVMTFKVQSWTAWNDSFDHARILRRLQDGLVGTDDLVVWAQRLGAALGRVHRSGGTADGGSAAEAVLLDVAGRGPDFVAEQVAQAQADVVRLRRDHRLFVSARVELGPWLGAEMLEVK
jgi:uncharacterized protein (DUF2252 family)